MYNFFGDCMNEEGLFATEKDFHKKYNNIYINDRQLEVLKKYDIDINTFNNIEELLFSIEEMLNDSDTEMPDLEWVSESLSEFNYYNNTNK